MSALQKLDVIKSSFLRSSLAESISSKHWFW